MKPATTLLLTFFPLLVFTSNTQDYNRKNAWKETSEVFMYGKYKVFAQADKTLSSENENALSTRVNMDTIPTLPSYSGSDFIPGEKILFFDDFNQDHTGKPASLWNSKGSVEVVNDNIFTGYWMKLEPENAIWTKALLDLPENYTIEFDVIPTRGNEGQMTGYGFRLMQSMNAISFDAGAFPGKAGFAFSCEYFGRAGYRTYINNEKGEGIGLSSYEDEDRYYQKADQPYHISIWVQNSRVRLYLNEHKLFDLPKAFPATAVKMDRLRFEDGAAMISNVRIAADVPGVRDKP